jgi:transcription initiation factor TFIID TATA-box-binding protein
MLESGVESGDCIELQCDAADTGATHAQRQLELSDSSFLSQLQPPAAQSGTWIPEAMHPRISNMVATVKLSCSLPLQALSDRMSNTEYNPRRFSALIARTKSPKSTALINASGKLIILGARSSQELDQAVRAHVRAIRKAGNPSCTVEHVAVINMVASCNIFAPLRLEALHLALGGSAGGAEFDMEIFPAIIYKLQDPSVTLLIFASGKINITGAASHAAIVAALEKVLPIVLLYKHD